MKTMKYMMLVLVCGLLAGCMDDGWEAPSHTGRGSKAVVPSNKVTIAQLKKDYKKYVETDYRDGVPYTKVDKNLQICGYVTGNDIEGNLYNEVAIEDSTGAILLEIGEGGLNGYLPVGTEIIVELKDLYVGNRGLQAEVGQPVTSNKGVTSLGRITSLVWNQHFNYTGRTKTIEPVVFNKATWDADRTTYAGQLAILKGVEFDVSGKDVTYATPNGGPGSKEIAFKDRSLRNVVLYTSNFCDFAASHVPTGKVNVTGIVKRYNNKWEFIVRSLKDVEIVK